MLSAALLAASVIGFDAAGLCLHASPVSWGGSCTTLAESPAGLARIEGPQAAVSAYSTGTGSTFGLYGAIPAGRFSIGAGAGRDTADPGFTSASAGASFVVTGNPHGFMEGFFGPSISAGASMEMTAHPGDSTRVLATASMQFSVFPTFAIGAAARGIPVLLPDGDESDVCGDYGMTYIFNRDFRLSASASDGRGRLGAELQVMKQICVRTGADDRTWAAGAGLNLGTVEADITVVFGDSTAHLAASVLYEFGEGSPWD